MHGQVQEQGRPCQFVDQHACARPHVADALAGLAVVVVLLLRGRWFVSELAPSGQHERGRGASCVERVGISERLRSKARASHATGRQVLQHGVRVGQQLQGDRCVLPRKTLEQALHGRFLQAGSQRRMPSRCDDRGPCGAQGGLLGGEMRDGAVELFQCVSQRCGDPCAKERRVDFADIDLHRFRRAGRATDQERQGLPFFPNQAAKTKARRRSVWIGPLEMTAQALTQGSQVLAAQDLVQTRIDRLAHGEGKRRSGSLSGRLARPSQVQRDTKMASMPSRRCNWQIDTPGSSA